MGKLNGEALLSTLHKFPSQQEVQYSTFVLAPISTQKFDFSGSQWLSHPLSIDHSLKLISTSPSCSFSGRYSTRCTFNTENKCNKFVWILSEIPNWLKFNMNASVRSHTLQNLWVLLQVCLYKPPSEGTLELWPIPSLRIDWFAIESFVKLQHGNSEFPFNALHAKQTRSSDIFVSNTTRVSLNVSSI